jgi:hypothetical protein
LYDADADALVTWLPLDPGLPALAEAPQELARRLRAAGVRTSVTPAEPERLSYKPGRRAVLRLGGHVLKAYGSARQFATAASGIRAGTGLPGIATPRCEAVVAPLRLTAQAAIEGEAATSLEAASEAGALLRSLQRADVPSLAPAPHGVPLEVAIRKAVLIEAVVPGLAPRVRRLVRRLERSAPPAAPLVPAHGDFHAGQLLHARGRLFVLDLDSLCLAPAALDVAEYVAAATEAGLESATAVLDALVEGYGAPPGRLDWHVAVATLVRASHPFHRALPGWTARVAAMVAAAETLAGRSALP